jgi:hypothetical protein
MTINTIKQQTGFPVEFQVSDGQLMANATAICTAWGFDVSKWVFAGSTRRYFYLVEAKHNCSAGLLIERRWSSTSREDEFWIHEALIFRLAQWLDANPGFSEYYTGCHEYLPGKIERQCEKWLAKLLLKNRVELLCQKHVETLREEWQWLALRGISEEGV